MPANKNIIVNLPGYKYADGNDYAPYLENGGIISIECGLPGADSTYSITLEVTDALSGSKMAPMMESDVVIENGKVKLYLFPVEG